MNTLSKVRRRLEALPSLVKLTIVVIVGTTLMAKADDPAGDGAAKKETGEKEAAEFQPLGPGDFSNWFEIGVGGFIPDGDRAQMQRRLGYPGGAFGGVEDFHLEEKMGKRGLFSLDGRGIFDNHDYLLKLQVSEPDKGYVQFGYREFRTWYDGSGGFFPLGTNNWFRLYDDEMHVDRGEAWFEAGLRIPNVPQLTLRYSHEFRSGDKDSTIWGDSTLTGLLPPNNSRAYVPTFLLLDEKRDTIAFDLEHKVTRTDFGLGVRYEHVDNNDSRNIHRRPGELTGSVTQAADRFVTQKDELDADLLNAHAFTSTRLHEKVLFTTGYSYTHLNTDVGGSRIYGADYDPVYDPLFARRQQRDEGFFDLSGGSIVDQYVVNLNLKYTPTECLAVVPSVRVEHQAQAGSASFTETDFGAAPARTAITEDLLNTQERSFTDVSEALEIRYSGLTNWVLYIRGEWLEGQEDVGERQGETDPDVPPAIIQRQTDTDRFTQKYVAGVNWYPHRRVNFGAQYYHKTRANDYTHNLDLTDNATNSNNRYPAFLVAQDFKTDDVNARITWRPMNNLTFITRYDFQLSTVRTEGDELAEVDSGKTRSHIFSESVSWTPLARLYLQGSVNYVLDQTEVPGGYSGAATNNILPAAKNNYWNVSALAGFALSPRTDIQVQYSYYLADNYLNNALYTMPYGASTEEHTVTATLNHQISKSIRWSLRYGYFTYSDKTSGGFNDYVAHMVYSSIQYRF